MRERERERGQGDKRQRKREWGDELATLKYHKSRQKVTSKSGCNSNNNNTLTKQQNH